MDAKNGKKMKPNHYICLEIFYKEFRTMNKKLRKTLSDLCKDFGLTEKALDELAEMSSQGLTEESSDEDVKKVADSLVPYAKMMQGEITRKTSKSKHEEEKSALLKQIEELKAKIQNPEPPRSDEPEWFKSYREKQEQAISELKQANDRFKIEQERKLRAEKISEKARELGIPSFMMKHVTIADDADYEKILADMKQDLVNNSLDGQFGGQRTNEAADKAAAIDFVEGL